MASNYVIAPAAGCGFQGEGWIIAKNQEQPGGFFALVVWNGETWENFDPGRVLPRGCYSQRGSDAAVVLAYIFACGRE